MSQYGLQHPSLGSLPVCVECERERVKERERARETGTERARERERERERESIIQRSQHGLKHPSLAFPRCICVRVCKCWYVCLFVFVCVHVCRVLARDVLGSFEIVSVVRLKLGRTCVHVHTRVYRVFTRELGYAGVLDRHLCIHEWHAVLEILISQFYFDKRKRV